MKYILVVVITMGSSINEKDPKTFEMRIPQENLRLAKSLQSFRFSLP